MSIIINENDVIKSIVNTNDGKLKSLDDLTSLGNRLFCIFIHLLLKNENCQKQKSSETLNWLKGFKAFKVSSTQFYRIISYFNETNYITEKSNQLKMIQKICNSNLPEEKKNGKADIPMVSKHEINGKADIPMVSKHEINEKIQSNCGLHTYLEMSKILGISKTNVTFRIKKNDIRFLKSVESCYFCKSDFQEKDELIEKLKSSCGTHSHQEMSKSLGISKSTLGYKMKRYAIKFVENNDCYFCKNKAPKCDSFSDISLSETKFSESPMHFSTPKAKRFKRSNPNIQKISFNELDSLNDSKNSSIFEGGNFQRRAKIDPIVNEIKNLAFNEETTFIQILSLIVQRYSNTTCLDFDDEKMKKIVNAIINVESGKDICDKKKIIK